VLRGYKRFIRPTAKRRRPKPVYNDQAILKALKKIWLAANLPCSKRLKAILPLWIPGYQSFFEPLPDQIVKRLLQISPATIDRLLQPVRLRYTGRGRTTTKPVTLIEIRSP